MIFDRFSKHKQISKSYPLSVGADLFHADGPTDGRTARQRERKSDRHDEVVSRFWQFCERA